MTKYVSPWGPRPLVCGKCGAVVPGTFRAYLDHYKANKRFKSFELCYDCMLEWLLDVEKKAQTNPDMAEAMRLTWGRKGRIIQPKEGMHPPSDRLRFVED